MCSKITVATLFLFVLLLAIVVCHPLPWRLDDYCHDDPMTRLCPDHDCEGPFPCISYCLENYPEREGIPPQGTGAWCDDLGTPTDYGEFCHSYPAVEGCSFWCTDHPGRCTLQIERPDGGLDGGLDDGGLDDGGLDDGG